MQFLLYWFQCQLPERREVFPGSCSINFKMKFTCAIEVSASIPEGYLKAHQINVS